MSINQLKRLAHISMIECHDLSWIKKFIEEIIKKGLYIIEDLL